MTTPVRAERMPEQRLITQNMLISAAGFEQSKPMTWSAIQDLSAFVDLFCLYDRVTVLGRGGDWQYGHKLSDFYGLLGDVEFIRIQDIGNELGNNLAKVATRHLALFLGEQDVEKYKDLLFNHQFSIQAHHIDSTDDLTLNEPSQLDSRLAREDVIKQLQREQTYERVSATFIARTFLYLAYADMANIGFSPDAIRCSWLERILIEEEQFRGRLLDGIKSSWEKNVPGDKGLLHRVSPFAAVVFTRAGKDKDRIVPIMKELRDELAADRMHLRQIEEKALWGTVEEAQTGIADWNNAVNVATRRFEHTSLLSVATQFGPSVAGAAGDVIDQQANIKSIIGLAGTLAKLPGYIANTVKGRRTLVGTHRLLNKSNLPATEKLRDSITELFGPITE